MFQNDDGVRIIYDCSSPAENSLNAASVSDIQIRYPYKMASVNNVVRDIMDWGKNACEILKIDLADAFKNIPVDPKRWADQVVKICQVFFCDARLLFGHVDSGRKYFSLENMNNKYFLFKAHAFVFSHLALQEILIMPHIRMRMSDVHLAIDDSSAVFLKEGGAAAEYYEKYTAVMGELGLSVKKK